MTIEILRQRGDDDHDPGESLRSAFTTGRSMIVDFAKAPTVRPWNIWLVLASTGSPRHLRRWLRRGSWC
jgi:hypothetical protein